MSNAYIHVVSLSTGNVFGFARRPGQDKGHSDRGRVRNRLTARQAVSTERAARPGIVWGPKDGKLNFYPTDLPYNAYGNRIGFRKCTCCTCDKSEAGCKCMCTYKMGR